MSNFTTPVSFDENNGNWSQRTYNSLFLKHIEIHMNNLLKSRGHLFLNEVYDALGIKRTSEGATSGWILDEKGAGKVVFYMTLKNDSENPAIELDFNVDEKPIHDRI